MEIYNLIFGTDHGQVNCPFHDDTHASAGIGPNGEFHCFTCEAKASNSEGFIAKYFNVSYQTATGIRNYLKKFFGYNYTKYPVTPEQKNYLNSIGINDACIAANFFRSGAGKLLYEHRMNGIRIGTTWFNHPTLPEYNASEPKYKYTIMKGGLCTPYDSTRIYDTLIICEGEKDMLTLSSMGAPNAVAKVGGAKTRIVTGNHFDCKQIILVYDCDKYGREGAVTDAEYLVEKHNCKVKIVDLGLQDTEDLNDYFMKYNHTLNDLYSLIKATPLYIAKPKVVKSKVETIVNSLTNDEAIELYNLLNIKLKQGGN